MTRGMTVGMDHRPRHHSAPDEGNQAVRGDIPDAPKADTAKALTVLLDGHRDDSLRLGFAVSLALFRNIDIGFVNLDRTGQQIPPGPDHRPAQLVQPSPSRLVTAEPKLPLQPECADPNLLAGHEPHRQKPHPQRFVGGLEDRARRQRCLAAACPTPQPSSRHRPRLLGRAAMAADESVRPSQTPNVIAAGLVTAEPFVHRLECLRIINPRHRRSCIFHPTSITPGNEGEIQLALYGIYSAEQGNIRVDQGIVAWVRRGFKSEAGIEPKFDTPPVRAPPPRAA